MSKLADQLLEEDYDRMPSDWEPKRIVSAIRGALFHKADLDTQKRIQYLLLHLPQSELVNLYNNALNMPGEEIDKKVATVRW